MKVWELVGIESFNLLICTLFAPAYFKIFINQEEGYICPSFLYVGVGLDWGSNSYLGMIFPY